MKHGAVYAAKKALSPIFQRSFVSGLVPCFIKNCKEIKKLPMFSHSYQEQLLLSDHANMTSKVTWYTHTLKPRSTILEQTTLNIR